MSIHRRPSQKPLKKRIKGMTLSARKAGARRCLARFCAGRALLLLLSLLFLGAAGPAGARILYVDPIGGDDGNTGEQENDAFKTLTRTFGAAVSGDTVIALPGTYSVAANRETFPFVLPAGVAVRSRNGAAVTVIQDDDDSSGDSTIRIILDGTQNHDQTRLEGFTIDGMSLTSNVNGIAIESSGAMTGTSPTIIRCTIVDYGGDPDYPGDGTGIFLTVDSSEGPSRLSAKIDGNTISNCDQGVMVYSDTGVTSNQAVEASDVCNNVIYGNNYGMVLVANPEGPPTFACSIETRIYHNTITQNLPDAAVAEGDGIGLFNWDSPTASMVPVTIVNNIIALNRGVGVYEDNASSDPGLVDSNDLFMNEGGMVLDEGTTTLTTVAEVNALAEAGLGRNFDGNPAFVSTGSHDYHILDISPCVNNADPDTMPEDDMDGQARPFPVGGVADVGADEWIPDTNLIRDHVHQILPTPDPPLSTILPLDEPCSSPTCVIFPAFQSGGEDPDPILYDPDKPLVFYRISPGTGIDIALTKVPAEETVRIDFH
jgi:hypothetical protein